MGGRPKTEDLLIKQSAEFTTRMQSELSNFRAEFLADVETKLAPIRSDVASNKSSIEEMQAQMAELKSEIVSMKNELSAQVKLTDKSRIYYSNSLNYYAQRLRAYSCRLHGFPLPPAMVEGMKSLQHLQYVYNMLIVPVLNIAIKEKRLKALPSFLSTIDVGHYLGRRKLTYAEATVASDQPQDDVEVESPAEGDEDTIAPFVLRFCTRTIRDLFMIFKKPVIEDFNTKTGSSLRVGEDLTPDNRANMSFLYDHEDVDKTRMRNSKVQFRFTGEEKWRQVLNPFVKDLALMQKAPLDPVPIGKIYSKPAAS